MSRHFHVCGHCGRDYWSTNSWVWVDPETDVVRGYYCSEDCRSRALLRRGWVRVGRDLVPPSGRPPAAVTGGADA